MGTPGPNRACSITFRGSTKVVRLAVNQKDAGSSPALGAMQNKESELEVYEIDPAWLEEMDRATAEIEAQYQAQLDEDRNAYRYVRD